MIFSAGAAELEGHALNFELFDGYVRKPMVVDEMLASIADALSDGGAGEPADAKLRLNADPV